AAGPEAVADHLVRVRLTRDRIGAGTLRRAVSGEARHRDVEAAPEEMYGAALADELAPEPLEHRFDRDENAEERLHRLRVVGAMHLVLVEANRVRHFHRH